LFEKSVKRRKELRAGESTEDLSSYTRVVEVKHRINFVKAVGFTFE